MSAIQMMLFGTRSSLASGALLLNDRLLTVISVGFFVPCSNILTYRFNTNGTLQSTFDGDSILFNTDNFGFYTGEWITGVGATPNLFSVRATVLSGSTAITGPLNVWLPITQTREWSISTFAENIGDIDQKQSIIKFDLAESTNTSNILESANVEFNVSSSVTAFDFNIPIT